jgi:electron transfer flavoprotein alpha subunit
MSVIVFAENIEGTYKKAIFEAVSYASKIAKNLNLSCIAVSIGNVEENKMNELAKYGADKIININNSAANQFVAEVYAKAIANLAQENNAQVVVISNTYSGKAISPRIAARLKAAIASGVISVPNTTNGFEVRRTVFSGKAFATINLTTPTKVIAITPNSFTLEENPKAIVIENHGGAVSESDKITNPTEVTRASGKIVLTEAEVVVSAGRGMKGPENWHLVEDLAATLGAATACSKPVSDMDWRPHNEHVGQTGITIKPNLYVAIGISGAIQHLAGVSSSKVIVVINKDPEAPFFKAADYGIVGDAFEVLPKLIAAAKALKAQNS